MEHIIIEGEEEAFQSEIEYHNAQNKFLEFMKYAEAWQKVEFISSILGMISLVAIVFIAIFQSQILESIKLSSAVMDEYKFVSLSQTCAKALEWGDSKNATSKQNLTAQFMAWISSILIILTILAIL